MMDSDYCLSLVSDRKQKIIRGIGASSKATLMILVINIAIRYARHELVYSLDEELQRQNISSSYRTTITGSVVYESGIISIPDMLILLEITSDQIDIMMQSVDQDYFESMPSLIAILSRLQSFQATLNNCNFVFDASGISLFMGADNPDVDSLFKQICSYKLCLETIQDWYTPIIDYGAICYGLKSVDRFIVRSFMQGVSKVKEGEIDTDYPFTLVVRDCDNLIIGYFLKNSPEQMFKIEIQGLIVHLNLYGQSSPCLLNCTGFFTPFSLLWRIQDNIIPQNSSLHEVLPTLIGSFHARSSDEVMQFLSNIGYQINRHFPDLSVCERIAG
jgi:hypothetical protein